MAIKINGNTVIADNQAFTTTSTVSATGNIIGGNIITAGSMTATGNITAANFNTTGSNVSTGNVNATGIVTATGNIIGGNLITGGNASVTGNLTAGNILGNVISTGPISTTGNVNGGNLNVTGNIVDTGALNIITGSNGNIALTPNGTGIVTTSSALSVTGTATAGNIATAGTVSATGNITGNFFIGNGSQLTGIDATAIQNGTANVRTFLNGNVTTSAGGTANVLNVTSTGTITTGTASVSGNVTAGNVSATNLTGTLATAAQPNITSVGTLTSLNSGAISSSGNVTGSNLLTGGLISATGNIFGGNALFSGNLTVNGNVTYINSNVVTINDIAINLANNAANVAQTNNGGLELGPQGSPYVTFLYNSSANTWVSSAGLSATANVVGGNITTAGLISATGNVQAGNVRTTGLISATGAITSSANITGGNILTGGLISATGAITSASDINGVNFVGSGVVSATGQLLMGGNLVTNSLRVCLANTASTGNDTDGAGIYLGPRTSPSASWSWNNGAGYWTPQVNAGVNVPSNLDAGNVRTTGFVSATGAITGASVTAIGNVQAGNVSTAGFVSATGNITGGNLNVTGNIVDTGALSIITGANGNLTLNAGTGFIIASSSILNGQANGVGNIGNSTGYFNTIFAKATSAQYADLAEKYTADADYEPGTVVMFGGAEEVTACTNDACRRVAGVISTNPSYIMNGTLESAHVATVALTGRVPTKVSGTVRKGDLMVSAGNGRARAEADPQVGTVIGKALADHDGAEGTIEVVVGRF